MALTPEDVVNKRFQPTKFREGYDQDEVDDFLDEVVVELRRLTQENDELKQRLAGSESRIAELQRSGGQAAAQPEPQAEPEAAPVPVPAAPAAAAPTAYPATDVDANDPASTNSLLQLARRLHEEHVREGLEKRDALIAEGHATAARVVAEAESKQRTQLGLLEQERSRLEHEIDELRTFEREYRQKLRGYIEGQLRDLDSAGGIGGNSAGGNKSDGSKSAGISAGSRADETEPGDKGGDSGDGSQPVSALSSTGTDDAPAFPGFAG